MFKMKKSKNVQTLYLSPIPGLSMGALFTSSGMMGDVMPCVDLPLFLMSGAFLRISSLPHWLYPLKYISHFYYGMDALSNIYWRQIDTIGMWTFKIIFVSLIQDEDVCKNYYKTFFCQTFCFISCLFYFQ